MQILQRERSHQVKRHIAYFKYVARHKWFVYKACKITGAPWWRSVIHDWTKFLPCEWSPYAESFYNLDGTKKEWKSRSFWEKIDFDLAWNHHQKSNKHHWQYWVMTTDSDEPRTKPVPIPEKYVKEMVADWCGAGMAITGRMELGEWYAKNKSKMIIHDITIPLVDKLVVDVENYFRVGKMLGIL